MAQDAVRAEGRERLREGAVYDARLARRLIRYVRPHQRWIWISFALLIAASASGLALPYLQGRAIDDYVAGGETHGLVRLLVVFVVLAVFEFVMKGLQTYTLDRAGQDALVDLRLGVFAHLQRLSSRYYDRTPTGRLIGRVTTDVEALAELFSQGVVTILGDFVMLAGTVAILLWMDWQLALASFAVVPVLMYVTMKVRFKVRAAYTTMISRRSRLYSFLHEQVQGMPLVQLFAREQESADGFGQINSELRDAQVESVWWESVLSAVTELIESLTKALLLWAGGLVIAAALLPDGSLSPGGLTIGALFTFYGMLERFFRPLVDLSQKYTVMQNAMTAADRIFALLDTDDSVPEPRDPVRVDGCRGALAFEDVVFGYDPDNPVLKGVSFRVEPGERVAVVGATGSGKSTLLRLLSRLYDVQQGRVTVDGVDVRDYALSDLRGRIGVVTQDVFLFEGDVLENLRLGGAIDESRALAAASALGLDKIVARFPAGYREPVRERGRNLSAGEAQLVSFARVLARSPAVLALDEATSNVDTGTEELLQGAVHTLTQGRTALIIAHRLSTIRDVDRILVLHKGELVESGTHEELLARGGVYEHLYRMQYREQEG
ncbi:MAG: ABC transporter ATP-binding protein [Planctomycetes bacterium]|nr:ABC transporter ATP-binding protein [Planctomycetota bacterium]MCB9903843.1 ABC transporter ATP-binding protein [Planctomycetota bacterium]